MDRTRSKSLWTRRRLLVTSPVLLLATGLGGSMPVTGCSGADDACVDPDALSSGERTLREGQRYVARSATRDADGAILTCAGCQFFQVDPTRAGCGLCQILGGPVSPQGHCSAWAGRPSS